MSDSILKKFKLSKELQDIADSVNVIVPKDRSELLDITFGPEKSDLFEVGYDIPGKGWVLEATVARCKNGASVNYVDTYMRRRDPSCMVIADDLPTDKVTFKERFKKDFDPIREDSFKWLKEQDELIFLPFYSGGDTLKHHSLLVAPKNAGFFVTGLSDLQRFLPHTDIPDDFEPKAVIYLIPPFRHTHFEGKQVVVHNRTETTHEMYSYNLYPGPSAKKGVYGFLLNIGEDQGWATLHTSSVKVLTPYEHEFNIMHEGASGGGKSEMLEKYHREPDGRILLGANTQSGEKFYINIEESSELFPVTDDMALCTPDMQDKESKKLSITDAENGWFLRVDHITRYGMVPELERLTIHPPEPLVFLNIDAGPGAVALLWDHTMDAPDKPCPNPRVILPRRLAENVVNQPIQVDMRSFGVRTPPCTKEKPTYGIIGLFHVLPASLAWLWRLVAPRGHANPSITESKALSSEGVGSYWPFATGKMVTQANILLKQILDTTETKYVLIPNQYIGIHKVGFMGEWLSREYLARRGDAKFKKEQLKAAKCPLLGFALENLKLGSTDIPHSFLQVDQQPEIGAEAYTEGARQLSNFFKEEVKKFLTPELDPIGKEIIELCLNDGTLEDYLKITPLNY